MIKDKRKQRRRPIRYTAWLALATGELVGCELSDISDTGARIDMEDTANIPDCFFLFLSTTGAVRRRCNVIWRKPRHLGVKFELNYAEPEPADATENPVTEPA